MNSVKLVWSTPDIDGLLAYIARVSNPDNQTNPNIAGLLGHMMREGHASPFEMCNVCVEINTTRDIGRQILRHKSLNFQEMSQRYQVTSVLEPSPLRECRLQDNKNRQNSLENDDLHLESWWMESQAEIRELAESKYHQAIDKGIAKEQARVLLPEGLTSSRIYANGNMRSWIFYLKQRLHPSTQKEHRLLAQEILTILRELAPVTMQAFFGE